MRKILLASVAVLGTSGGAWAQTYQSQGTQALPWTKFYGANNNINTNGTPQPGGAKNPDPGTVVIHLNGRVWAGVDLAWSTLSNISSGANPNSSVRYKSNPLGVASYMRLYPGFDGRATNGLRYGASVEIRQNIMSSNVFNPSATGSQSTGSFSSASGYSSAETLYTRRAFTYIGSDQLGIIRLGQAGGVVALFNSTGVFTTGTWNLLGGILDGDTESFTTSNFLLAWGWLAGNGIEYTQNRIAYMSPSFYGFDFAMDFSPSGTNAFGNGSTSSPYQTGTCAVESANCANVTGGNDSSRPYNRVSAGIRYQGEFSGLAAKAFVLYTHSAKESITSVPNQGFQAGSGATPLALATGQLRYDPQSFIQSGVALSYQGLSANVAFSTGRYAPNNNGLIPNGAAPTVATLIGVGYANGPWVTGTNIAFEDWQGSAQYTHISQRHEFAFTYMVGYKLAPGINIAAEYLYIQKHQGGFDFYANGANPGRVTTPVGNDIHAQGLTFATILSW